jgi:hypothetical protein
MTCEISERCEITSACPPYLYRASTGVLLLRYSQSFALEQF